MTSRKRSRAEGEKPPEEWTEGQAVPAVWTAKIEEPTPTDLEAVEEVEVEAVPEIEDHEIVDDSVRMYLREIGRVPLLTWEGEKHLAMQMEAGKTLEDIRARLEKSHVSREPTAAEILRDIYAGLRTTGTSCQKFCAHLHLRTDHPVQMIREMGIHFEIDSETTAQVAEELKMPQKDLDSRQIKLAVEARLMPEEALDAIGAPDRAARTTPPAPQDVFEAITPHEEQLARYQAGSARTPTPPAAI